MDSLPIYYDSVKNKQLIDGVVEYHSLRDKIKNAAPNGRGTELLSSIMDNGLDYFF